MKDRIRRWFQTRGPVCPAKVMALGAIAVTGCEALTLDREPEVAHLEIGSIGVSQVTLITSQWFIEVEDPECAGQLGCPTLIQLVESDTAEVSLPFRRSYHFDFRLQFFAETYPVDPVPATLSMKVHLDDEEWYNDSRPLLPVNAEGERESLRFVYQYHIPRLGS